MLRATENPMELSTLKVLRQMIQSLSHLPLILIIELIWTRFTRHAVEPGVSCIRYQYLQKSNEQATMTQAGSVNPYHPEKYNDSFRSNALFPTAVAL